MNFFKKQFSIRADYRSRAVNDPYFDGTSVKSNFIYQPHVYELAVDLARKSGATTIIDIGAGNGEKLKEYRDEFNIIAIDCEVNLNELKTNLPDSLVLNFDLEQGLPKIEQSILENSVLISADVIEHLINPTKYLIDISKYEKFAKFVLLSTPDRARVRGVNSTGPPANLAHVREWTGVELNALLRSFGIGAIFTGYTINTNMHKDKSTILNLFGKEMLSQESERKISALAIVTLYNEEDVVGDTIEHLISQGMDVHVIDNWSNDKSVEIVNELAVKYDNRVTYEKFPNSKPETYDWAEILGRVDDYAASADYDWIMHNDADEFRIAAFGKHTLVDAISLIDKKGYNSVDFTVLDFRPTNDEVQELGKLSTYRGFEFGVRPGHFQQVKCWKNPKKSVKLAKSGGHLAFLEDQRVYPINFLTKHYPLRTPEQAKKKIFEERLPRLNKGEKKSGWHGQYNSFSENDAFNWDINELAVFNSETYWEEYLVEQISRIGLPKE